MTADRSAIRVMTAFRGYYIWLNDCLWDERGEIYFFHSTTTLLSKSDT